MLAVAVKRYHWFPSGVEAPMAMATCYHSPGSLSFPLRRGSPLLLCVPHRHRPLFCLSSPLSPSFSRPLLCHLTIMPGKHSLSRASRERKANRRFQRSLGWEGCESTIVSTISWIIYSSLPHVHSRVIYIYIYIFAEEGGSSFHPFRLLEAY